jgi:hypothetical protein
MLTSGPAELCYFYINLNSEKEYGTYQTLISDGEDLICCNTKTACNREISPKKVNTPAGAATPWSLAACSRCKWPALVQNDLNMARAARLRPEHALSRSNGWSAGVVGARLEGRSTHLELGARGCKTWAGERWARRSCRAWPRGTSSLAGVRGAQPQGRSSTPPSTSPGLPPPSLFAQALAGMEIEQERGSVVLDPLAVVEIELEKERRR